MSDTLYLEYTVAFLALYITIFYLLAYLKNRDEIKRKVEEVGWQPRISVIIPAYNEEAGIAKCIESVLASDYPQEKLEIIVVDDGSPDRTGEVAARFAERGVKVLRKANSGKANSMNFGIAHASGEIIATLDADSYVSRGAIKRMLPLFESADVAAVTAAVKVSEPKNFLERLQNVEYLYTIFSRRVLVVLESVHVTPGPFSMFRKSVFGEIGGFDPNNILEDQEIAMRIQSRNYKIRSSIDAEVFTEVPTGFMELLKQRTRWHRGGLRNAIKYLGLIGPKYGDLGMFVMPLGFVAVVAIFLVMASAAYAYLTKPSYIALLGLDGLLLSIGPLHIVGAVLFALTLAWAVYAIRKMEKSENDLVYIALYVILYGYLITLFWVSAIYRELKNDKLSW